MLKISDPPYVIFGHWKFYGMDFKGISFEKWYWTSKFWEKSCRKYRILRWWFLGNFFVRRRSRPMLVLHVLCPSCEVKWVKWKKSDPFLVLWFSWNSYTIMDHVYTFDPIWIEMCSQLFNGLKILQTFGDLTDPNQNHNFTMIFLYLTKSIGSSVGDFWAQF